MKPPPFRYESPETIEDAIRLFAAAGGEAVALAGGQSLIPLLRYRLVRPELVVDLRRIPDAATISSAAGGNVELGAMVTHRAMERWAGEHGHPILTEAIENIGNPAVRTMGTAVGSLAHADPSAEWAAVALVLAGSCRIAGPDGERFVPVSELFTGPYSTSIGGDELIVGLRLRMPDPGCGASFAEVAPRRGDPALAGAAARICLDEDGVVTEAAVGLIGLGPTPCRSPSVEARLIGSPPGDAIEEAAAEVTSDIAPIGDIHGSAEYRLSMAPVVVGRAVRLAVGRAERSGR